MNSTGTKKKFTVTKVHYKRGSPSVHNNDGTGIRKRFTKLKVHYNRGHYNGGAQSVLCWLTPNRAPTAISSRPKSFLADGEFDLDTQIVQHVLDGAGRLRNELLDQMRRNVKVQTA